MLGPARHRSTSDHAMPMFEPTSTIAVVHWSHIRHVTPCKKVVSGHSYSLFIYVHDEHPTNNTQQCTYAKMTEHLRQATAASPIQNGRSEQCKTDRPPVCLHTTQKPEDAQPCYNKMVTSPRACTIPDQRVPRVYRAPAHQIRCTSR